MSVDAHPLLREYFAKHVREVGHIGNVPHTYEPWRAALGRLFAFLCGCVEEFQPDTLDRLQPLAEWGSGWSAAELRYCSHGGQVSGKIGRNACDGFCLNVRQLKFSWRYARGVRKQTGATMWMPVATVPLAKGAKLSLQTILHNFIATWPRLPRPVNPTKSEQELSFNVGGSTVVFRVVSAAIRTPDFARACRESWFWPDAHSKLEDHVGHVVVSVNSKETRLNQVKFLSLAVTALLISTPQALGVHWCDANLVVPPEMFREFCVKMLPDSLPLYIWVDFRVSKNPQGKSMGYTHGLSQFGLMEMETLNSSEDLEGLRKRLFGLAVYLIENGLIVKNGDTIGDDDQEKVTVVYCDSSFGNSKRVMRLDYHSLEKSGRKR